MEANNIGDALTLIMNERGWTQVRLAAELDISQPRVSRLISGERDLKINDAADLLSRVGWQVRMTPLGEDSDPVKRRDFNAKFVAAVAGVTFVPFAKHGPYEDAGYVQTLANRIDAAYETQGGNSVVPIALRHVSKVYPAVNGRSVELKSASSDLARKASQILYDADQLQRAEHVGRIALDLARQAGDSKLQADAYANLSMIASAQGHPDRSAEYARKGLQVNDLSPFDYLWLQIRKARALACIEGQYHASRDAIDQACYHLDGAGDFERLPSVIGNIGIALGNIGLHEDGFTELDHSVRLLEPISPLMHGLYLGRQIQIVLRAEDPSRAAHLISSLAHVAPLLSSRQLNICMADILRKSKPWRSVGEMRDAREQLISIIPRAADQGN